MALIAHPLFGRFDGRGSPASLWSLLPAPVHSWVGADSLQTLKRQLLAAQALLRPGFMTLRAIRQDGRVTDFEWSFASSAAGRMLSCNAVDLYGKRLRAVLHGQDGCQAVFEQYRCVVEQGGASATQQLHRTHGSHATYRHGAVRVGDGVAVTLINLSAAHRARALEMALRAQQAMTAAYAR
jgi:hypothetical protein